MIRSIYCKLIKNQFSYKGLLGVLIEEIVLIIIQQIKIKYRENDIPENDERVTNNLLQFFAYVSHATLGLDLFSLILTQSLFLLVDLYI